MRFCNVIRETNPIDEFSLKRYIDPPGKNADLVGTLYLSKKLLAELTLICYGHPVNIPTHGVPLGTYYPGSYFN